ncbi:hypothetical protein [Methylobacterium sp. 37f]|uniref:hypothetical protein n=1 Tax=Methylobacterium sp. 37f TaxID=2817058 RepID=UPI001FFCB9DE|nr:hypothetical protein [Methylobacterium sp. 37f]MCK2054732.1 hypothetical protein [Methylobacterium sp. 37f]
MTVVMLLCAATQAQARSAWITGTFVYADLCTVRDNGARNGHRVMLRRSPNGNAVTFEGADHIGPVAVEAMSLDDSTRALTFAVSTETGAIRFQGVVEPGALTGTIEDEAGLHAVHLPRVLRSRTHETCSDEITGAIGQRQ